MKRILCFVLVVAVVLCACACGGNPATADGKLTKDVNLYFSNADYNNIRSEKRTITYSENDVFAQLVVQKLLDGPLDINT